MANSCGKMSPHVPWTMCSLNVPPKTSCSLNVPP
ncbi:hypothetical protein AVEN_173198-1, partial [Araneus ventricosus]